MSKKILCLCIGVCIGVQVMSLQSTSSYTTFSTVPAKNQLLLQEELFEDTLDS